MNFTIWKTIKLGVHKTADAYRQSILAQKNRINDYADEILNKMTVSPTETEIDLAIVTMADLGFKRAARYDVICERIVRIGAQMCPTEVGPALRDQYPNQPLGEDNVIATEPLTSFGGGEDVFRVSHSSEGVRLLSTRYVRRDERKWNPDVRLVVVVPRKKK